MREREILGEMKWCHRTSAVSVNLRGSGTPWLLCRLNEIICVVSPERELAHSRHSAFASLCCLELLHSALLLPLLEIGLQLAGAAHSDQPSWTL